MCARRPHAPSNLRVASVSPTQLRLTWSDNSGDESDFHIERSPNNSNWNQIDTVGAGVTSYTDSGLTTGTTYYYRVRAHRDNGDKYSDYSNTASGAPQPPAPGPFSKISPTNGSTEISTSPTLSWGVSSGATSYEYCYDTTNDSACSTWTSTTGTSASVSLSAGTTYYWQVQARNAAGTTDASGGWWPFTTETTIVASPSNLNATADSQTQNSVVWADNSSDESDFHIERSPSGTDSGPKSGQ